jgi:predicted GNAT family N-acyltransferase
MVVLEPRTTRDFERYFDLRWRNLREPWGLPKGTERDERDDAAIHLMVCGKSRGELMGVARLNFNSPSEAQLGMLAVDRGFRGLGVGELLVCERERITRERGATRIVATVREWTVTFHERLGYQVVSSAHTVEGVIPHVWVEKILPQELALPSVAIAAG